MMRRCTAGLIGLLALHTHALAQDPPEPSETVPRGIEDAEQIYNEGLERYSAGDYSGAIELWQRSYQLSRLPSILFNVASAYEDAGMQREALETWQAFLLVSPADDRKETQARISALMLVLGESPAPAPAPAPAIEPAPEPVAAPAPEPEPEPEEIAPGGGGRAVALGTMGIGGLGVSVGGALLSIQANSRAADTALGSCVTLQGSALCTEAGTASLRQDRLQYGLGLGLVSGGVVLGSSALLLALRGGEEPKTSLSLGPQNTLSLAHRW